MQKREFYSTLKTICDKKSGFVDLTLIPNLSDKMRSDMVYFIVRHRQPVIWQLIPAGFDSQWLHSMGYLYVKHGTRYSFVCTSENRIK